MFTEKIWEKSFKIGMKNK